MTDAADITVRPGNAGDFEAVLEMSRRFWALTGYPEAFDPEHTRGNVELAHDSDLLLVLLEGQDVIGFIAGVAMPLLGSRAALQVTELGFWVEPERRGRGLLLLDGLERAARIRGAKYINMIAMQSSSPAIAEAIYRRRGYALRETVWTKEL